MKRIVVACAAVAACKGAKAPPPAPPPPVVAMADAVPDAVPAAPEAAIDAAPEADCTDAQACFDRGRTHEGARDTQGAYVAYGRACQLGSRAGCQNAGAIAHDKLQPPDFAAAAGFFTQGCGLAGAASCVALSGMYELGQGVGKDEVKSVQLLQRACDGNDPDGCYGLGLAYEGGIGIATSPPFALAAYDKACAMTDADRAEPIALACERAGVDWMAGKGAHLDLAKAGQRYRRACDLAAKECLVIGMFEEHGKNGAPDLPRARVDYGRACDAGNAGACNNLGQLEAPTDRTAARIHLQRGCDAGLPIACTNVAKLK